MDDFEPWYEEQRPRVLSACFALGGDADAAREATDEAFTRALERWRKVQAMTAPGGWVQVVALNHLRRGWRRRRLERVAFTTGTSRVAVASPPPDAELWMVVSALPTRQQTVVILRYVHDLPEAAIAEAMGVARGTVASTLSAAHANLRRRMTEPIITEEPIHG
jgi:DNA-directed RNA polymerase specialized sigma24 family protein